MVRCCTQMIHDRFKDARDAIAIRPLQVHPIATPEDTRKMIWEQIPANEVNSMALYHGMRRITC